MAWRAKSNSDGRRSAPRAGGPGDPNIFERAVDGERRRGQHGRVHPVEQQLAHDGRDVDRRGAQEHAAPAKLHEIHVIRPSPALSRNRRSSRISPARRASASTDPPAPRVVARLSRGVGFQSAIVDSTRSSAPVRYKRLAFTRIRQGRLGSRAPALHGAVTRGLRPDRRRIARVIAQLIYGLGDLDRSCDPTRRPRRGKTLDVAREILDAVGADGKSEILRGDVLELMRFVDDGVVARGDDLAVRALPHRRIRAQQMMIDDHDVRRRGALPHARDETVVVARAFGAETRLGGRRDLVPEGRSSGRSSSSARSPVSVRPPIGG